MQRSLVIANMLAVNWKLAGDVTVTPNENGEVTVKYALQLDEDEEGEVMGLQLSVSDNVEKVVAKIVKDGDIVQQPVREATSTFCLLKRQCRVSW